VKRIVRTLAILIAVAAIASTAVAQQQVEALKKGFQPEKLYQFGGIDSVNVFNGNLLINLPIGLSYPLNGGLSYGLTLSYNAKAWDVFNSANGTQTGYPSQRANAGLGWLIGMGRFIGANDPANLGLLDTYEAADGGDHPFKGSRTDDGSNLRLRSSGSGKDVDSPDGVSRHFESIGNGRYELRSISSALGDQTVQIAYLTPSAATPAPAACGNVPSFWKITDTLRTHYVCFQNEMVDAAPTPMVSAVLTQMPNGGYAFYQFDYDRNVVTGRPIEDTNNNSSSWIPNHTVALLKSITIPDGSTYEMTYSGQDFTLDTLTLPTKGRIKYVFGERRIPSVDFCANAGGFDYGFGLGGRSIGVISRTFISAAPAGQQAESRSWYYGSTLSPDGGYPSTYNCTKPTPQDPNVVPTYPQLYEDMVVRVTDPTGAVVDNHFSVFPGHDLGHLPDQDISTNGFERKYYSLPYGPKHPDTTLDLHLSQEFRATAAAAPARQIWSRHDVVVTQDIPPYENRLATQRTVHLDDCQGSGTNAICKWTESASTDWDTFGHYRTVTQASNFGNGADARTTTTSWNVNRTFGVNDPWLLGTYDDIVTTDGLTTTVEQACFNRLTGFLRAQRKLKTTAPGENDLLSIFTADAHGNLITEKYFGGDITPIPGTGATSGICAAADALETSSAPYTLDHTWENGQMKTAKYGTLLTLMDLTIDVTGLPTSWRDASGLQTDYAYDTTGRFQTITAPNGVTTTYTYSKAVAHASGADQVLDQPARVNAVVASGATIGSKQVFQYDSFGRLWRTKQLMPDNTWSLRETIYDKLDRKYTSSEAEVLPGADSAGAAAGELTYALTHKTTYLYDMFGRPLTVTGPDQKTTTMSYTGVRSMVRSVPTALAIGELPAATTEEYDALGRLASVVEQSEPNEAQATTTYRYEVGGHLKSVQAGVQSRTFTYDGRGLMTNEAHPENGPWKYTYDARGHLKTKKVDGGSPTVFDLTFDYDAAERLRQITAENPGGFPPTKTYKIFTYATANAVSGGVTDYANGKLRSAERLNYNAGNGTYSVLETYTYADPAGRMSNKTTAVSRVTFSQGPNGVTSASTPVQQFTQSYAYNAFGDRNSVSYPACLLIPCGNTTNSVVSAQSQYTNGRLTGVTNYASSLSYAPSGMLTGVTHTNGVTDTIDPDASGLPRPQKITFNGAQTCVPPAARIEVRDPNTDAVISSTVPSGTAVKLVAIVTAGSGTPQYSWSVTPPVTTPSYTTPAITQQTTYTVTIIGPCGTIKVNVTIFVCSTVSITSQPASTTIGSGLSASLTVGVSGGSSPSYQWYQGASPSTATPLTTPSATTSTLNTGTLTATTQYWVRVTSCGQFVDSNTATVTVNPPLPQPGLLTATRTGSNQIGVSWGASAGADHYRLERRSGGTWSAPFDVFATSYPDSGLGAGLTFVYRVRAVDAAGGSLSPYSNSDLATLMLFTTATSGSTITAARFNELMTALNAIRNAAGLAATTWSAILPAGVAAPATNGAVLAAHVNSMRSAMDTAMAAAGVGVPSGPTAAVGGAVTASAMQQLQGRAQ
jgi:YD repeat-containing protein